jgi:hypothetical protein
MVSALKNNMAGQVLTFVLEKVTNENRHKWIYFINIQLASAKEEDALLKNSDHDTIIVKNRKINEDLQNAIDVFQKFIEPVNNTQTWIAYAKKHDEIEMCLTVTTQHTLHPEDDAPITSHMGIFRPVNFSSPKTRDLSILLHAFAARATKIMHPEKKYMYTFPLPVMHKILFNNIPSDKIWKTAPCTLQHKTTRTISAPFYIPPMDSKSIKITINGSANLYDQPAYLTAHRKFFQGYIMYHTILDLYYLASKWGAL